MENLKIIVTRIDKFAGVPDFNASQILSKEEFTEWDAVFEYLKSLAVPINAEHEEQIKTNDKGTYFFHNEFVNYGYAAAGVNVLYEIRTEAI